MYQSRGTDGGSEVKSNQAEHIKIQEEERPNLGNVKRDNYGQLRYEIYWNNSPTHVTYGIAQQPGQGKMPTTPTP
jgi:hypothetical protein